MNFDYCLTYLLKREGGFVNNPNDRGGPTNLGITIKTLGAWRNNAVTPDDVRLLTRPEAAAIYKASYWNALRLDEISAATICLILFDQAVNRGPQSLVKMLQQVLNANFHYELAADGVMGDKTVYAANAARADILARKLIQGSQIHYVELACKDPTQLVFLQGWMNRTFELADSAT